MENKAPKKPHVTPTNIGSGAAKKGNTNRIIAERQASVPVGMVNGNRPRRLERMPSSSSDDGIQTNVLAAKQKIDLIEWENNAKSVIRSFCLEKGRSTKDFYSVEEPKKFQSTRKVFLPPPQVSINKLIHIFKALEKLMAEEHLPGVDVIQLLKPLAESFLVKKCAAYWHAYAKAAIVSSEYALAVEVLDRASALKAEPIMERLRTYHYVCHALLEKLEKGPGGHPDAAVGEGVWAIDISDHRGDGDGDAIGKGHSSGIAPKRNGSKGETVGEDDQESSETGDAADGIAEEDTQPENALSETDQTFEAGDQLEHSAQASHKENGHDACEYMGDGEEIDRRTCTIFPAVIITELEQAADEELDTAVSEESIIDVSEDDDNEQPANESRATADVTASSPALQAAASSTRRSHSREKIDQSAIFKSTTTKLVVVKNKSAKKEPNVPEYFVTPVRRSTRKTGHDKWNTYRTPSVESPSDLVPLGVSLENSEFKKNPYLRVPHYDSDE